MPDPTRITVFCFAASYTLALLLEVAAFAGWTRGGWRRTAVALLTSAGLLAHFLYLVLRAREQSTPLSSPYDWSLLAALLLAVVCLATTIMLRRWSLGLYLLPLVLGLIAASRGASTAPFAPERASLFWGMTHGWLLLLATVAMSLGLVAGLMYLTQSWRLKRKLPSLGGFSLPSLEWLERVGGRTLAASAWLTAGGFASGLVLSTLKHRGDADYQLWADPVVLSLGALLVWLTLAEGLRYASPDSRRGTHAAYLSIISFALLAVTLLSITIKGSVHGTSARPEAVGHRDAVPASPPAPFNRSPSA